MNNFLQATKLKLRFDSKIGQLTTEQLWDLPLEAKRGVSLKAIATDLQSQISSQPVEALDFFKSAAPTVDPILQLKFNIVKEVVLHKIEEKEAKSKAKAVESKRSELEALIKSKEQEAQSSKSIAELKAELEALK